MRRIVIVALLAALGCGGNAGTPNKSEGQQAVSSPLPPYPSPASWEHANKRQRDRALRSFAQLKRRCVPVYHGPLFVQDDEEVSRRSAADVARRTLVLWAVELRAEGLPQDEARAIIDGQKLWAYVSPKEKQFLDEKEPSAETCQDLVWRLESLWVLMWALGHIDELNWPSGMCDVNRLATLISNFEDDPKFISSAKLRPIGDLLDAQDLILRIHWATTDALLHQGGTIPEELDWCGAPEYVAVGLCAAARVVEERHYVLNWLVNHMAPKSWDEVDTST